MASFPLPVAVRVRLVSVVGAFDWLVHWTWRTGTLEAPGIWVELGGEAKPGVRRIRGGVATGVKVLVEVKEGVKVGVKVLVGGFVPVKV